MKIFDNVDDLIEALDGMLRQKFGARSASERAPASGGEVVPFPKKLRLRV